MKIEYIDNLKEFKNIEFEGFFVGWTKEIPKNFLQDILINSTYNAVAVLNKTKAIGFITANSDKVVSAYIPLIEVLPEFQKQGIGKKLMEHILKNLRDIYMIDLLCDDEIVDYYLKQGFQKSNGMFKRNYN